MPELKPGATGEAELVVSETLTAAEYGSGLVRTFSTPAMIGLMENAAVAAIAGKLPKGQTTVGTAVNIKHLAPTPIGIKVTARAELTHVDGRRLHFQVHAWDQTAKIGEGTHDRYIVDKKHFEERAAQKAAHAHQ